ncbi:MAG: alpha/beta hydrolase [Bacteroidales bacterium]
MKRVMYIITTLIIIYGIVLGFFYFSQSSMLFFPQQIGHQKTYDNTEEVRIETSNGNQLHGWLCKSDSGKDTLTNLIIYFGGNAEEVSHLIPAISSRLNGWSVLVINYPGYGLSKGKPSEKSFFNAALAIYDYADSRKDICSNNIVLLGRSIGTGCASYLAANREVKGVVLVSPFESMKSVAQSKLPYIPVSLLLKHQFDSNKYAQEIDASMLAFFGTADDLVPPIHAKRLAKSWKGDVTLIQLEGYNHNNILESEKLWSEMIAFLDKL